MNKIQVTILKFAFSGKYLEVWLDGLPFRKITEWDEEKDSAFETNEDQWNFCCKPYQFKEWFIRDTKNQISIDEVLLFNGWNHFVGKKCLYNESNRQLEFVIDSYI